MKESENVAPDDKTLDDLQVPEKSVSIGEIVDREANRRATRAVRQYAQKLRERSKNKRRRASRNKNRKSK